MTKQRGSRHIGQRKGCYTPSRKCRGNAVVDGEHRQQRGQNKQLGPDQKHGQATDDQCGRWSDRRDVHKSTLLEEPSVVASREQNFTLAATPKSRRNRGGASGSTAQARRAPQSEGISGARASRWALRTILSNWLHTPSSAS